MSANHSITFHVGDVAAQADFLQRHSRFVERLPTYQSAIEFVSDKARPRTMSYRLPYFLFHLMTEDFYEILTLLANGHSTGAMKILRAMFEHTVTLAYLVKNPGSIRTFNAFHPITVHKEVHFIEREYPGSFPPAFVNRVDKEYQSARPRFLQGSRVRISWGPSMIDMARDVGFDANVVLTGYYRPLQETHPSVASMLRRLNAEPDGSMTFDASAKPTEDKAVLLIASILFRTGFDSAIRRFKLTKSAAPLKAELDELERYVWGSS